MSDRYENHATGLESPAIRIVAITPDDGADLGEAVRGLNVAGAGSVRIRTVGGSEGTIFVAAGAAFPVRVARVYASGTTASGIVGLI
ncbi:spike base protein, RCAP_Rcc01079 family [Wenxinia marina]|uniref:Uncharacterized protein n=1 Tax=Wenxinia marina DSM 24838 TaxID=1123501 RepID=A0A0D0Q5K0_9RHOB|nr:hypothetical protein [Wenxinia marina]KIQ67767.1 hypothetical protein Wenmar_03727 [Wenxinia marina DSM 24838]GGL77403.1 hypothetical protein GCM10011392_34790 [Wenxinia marina]